MTETTPPAPGADIGFDFNRPTIIALLYLASFLTGITGLVGLILAYVWKSEPGDEWARSDIDGNQDQEEGHPHLRPFWEGVHRNAQYPISTELHQHAGVQHRNRSWG